MWLMMIKSSHCHTKKNCTIHVWRMDSPRLFLLWTQTRIRVWGWASQGTRQHKSLQRVAPPPSRLPHPPSYLPPPAHWEPFHSPFSTFPHPTPLFHTPAYHVGLAGDTVTPLALWRWQQNCKMWYLKAFENEANGCFSNWSDDVLWLRV